MMAMLVIDLINPKEQTCLRMMFFKIFLANTTFLRIAPQGGRGELKERMNIKWWRKRSWRELGVKERKKKKNEIFCKPTGQTTDYKTQSVKIRNTKETAVCFLFSVLVIVNCLTSYFTHFNASYKQRPL